MIEETNMAVMTTKPEVIKWTRVNRHDLNERSVIDYILMTNKVAMTTTFVEIDEDGQYHPKSNNAETDHNTIIFDIECKRTKQVKKSNQIQLPEKTRMGKIQ